MKHMNEAAGYPASGATPESMLAFEQALHEFRCYINDPVATVDDAIAASPSMVMAHVLKAYLHLLGTEPAGLPVARACLDAAVSAARERTREVSPRSRTPNHLRALARRRPHPRRPER